MKRKKATRKKPKAPDGRISPWAALAWGVAIDLVMCVLSIQGPLAFMLAYPDTFIALMLVVPLVILFLITICNSPRYKHLTRDKS